MYLSDLLLGKFEVVLGVLIIEFSEVGEFDEESRVKDGSVVGAIAPPEVLPEKLQVVVLEGLDGGCAEQPRTITSEENSQ